MKTCLYDFKNGLYKMECGGQFTSRPITKCDKCGRKPIEAKQDATNVTRTRLRVG